MYAYFKPHYHPPKLNPHPKYFLIIKGTVAPEFRNVGHLVFMASYSASKNACFHETNILAGITTAESRTHYYWIKPNKSNHYKIKIPIDKYQYGECGWIPYTITGDFVKNKQNATEYALVSIGEEGTQKWNPKKIEYFCNTPDLNKCIIKVSNKKSPLVIMRPEQSYHLIFNIKYQKRIKEEFNDYN